MQKRRLTKPHVAPPVFTHESFCGSASCMAVEKAAGGPSGTWDGSRLTRHEWVDSALDPVNGWKSSITTQGGCRDSRADYRTHRCVECGHISTWDFAKD